MTEETKTKKAAAKKPAAKEAAPKKAAAEKPVKAAEPKAAKAEKAEAAPAPAKAKKADAPKREKKTDTGVKKQGKVVADYRLYDVIQRPIITEKSTMAAEHGKVVFKISPTATKEDVKHAVEALFGVKVTKVNTILLKGKTKKFRGRNGKRSDTRKAVVTLAAGQTIDIASGLR